MYLTRDAIAATLAAARTLAPGTELVVEYAVQRDDADPRVQAGVRELSRRVAALGEPWQTRFAPGEAPALLRGLGFTVLEDLGPEDTLGRYAGAAAAARAPRGAARLVVAQVPPR
jgi:O-methyltransferase involved in polyketide biosynthesis